MLTQLLILSVRYAKKWLLEIKNPALGRADSKLTTASYLPGNKSSLRICVLKNKSLNSGRMQPGYMVGSRTNCFNSVILKIKNPANACGACVLLKNDFIFL